MNAEGHAAEPVNDRLVRFRGLAARLDPAGDPARALADGLYVQPSRAAGSRIAAELEIAPSSSHLLIGGVGSGKTTELLGVQRQLNVVGDTRAFYLDVTRNHDIAKVAAGVVAIQVGLELVERLIVEAPTEEERRSMAEDARRLRITAHGYWTDGYDREDDEHMSRVPGILVSPDDQIAEAVRDMVEMMKPHIASLRASTPHMVILIDGLDRLTDMSAFEQIIEHDIKALTSLGVGVVLVGPLRSLYGIDRTIEQRFDRTHYQPWIDLASGPDADKFLTEILRKRLPAEVMDGQALSALVHHSGGVLRDLIALAQLACLETYLDGSELVGLYQAVSAIDSFGRKHMQGLRSKEIEVLQRVRTAGAFLQTSEDDLALLMTRRVLEYRINARPHYAVHPTIAPFLAEMAGEKG